LRQLEFTNKVSSLVDVELFADWDSQFLQTAFHIRCDYEKIPAIENFFSQHANDAQDYLTFFQFLELEDLSALWIF
jgi:hypothetical protein